VRNVIDFSSWNALFTTLLGLAVVTLIMVGVRLLVMQTVQQRRERENRQINERLRTLIAAYKSLGGSFTGELAVDPTHLRDLRRRGEPTEAANFELASSGGETGPTLPSFNDDSTGSDRRRRVRDTVEAALSDVILLGTEEQVRLAAGAAADLAAGREIETAELVASLRDFIRKVLDLEPLPADLLIPKQGPLRPIASRGGARGERNKDAGHEGRSGSQGGGAGAGGSGLGGSLSGSNEPDR
jgi:heme exporter protein D